MFKEFFRSNYLLYSILILIFRKSYKELLVSSKTDIVIEGFPRSANTFSVLAFHYCNDKVKIAHHLHNIAQLKGALKLKIPIIVVIREPEAAIKSYLVREPDVSISSAIKKYEKFYCFVKKNKTKFVIADFNKAINSFDEIIKEVNQKYDKKFNIFLNDEKSKINVLNDIKLLSKTVDKKAGSLGIASPSPKKEEEKLKINIPEKKLFKCKQIYKSITTKN